MKVWAPLLLLLFFAACRSRVQTERSFEAFGGVGVAALPSVGAAVIAGQRFSEREKFDLDFELRAIFQGGDDSATQSGKFFQVQAGVKQTLNPGHRRRPFLRFGATWFRSTGNPDLIDQPGDYLGIYVGGGYEFDVSPRVTISPDVSLNLVNGEGSIGGEFLPSFALNVLFRF